MSVSPSGAAATRSTSSMCFTAAACALGGGARLRAAPPPSATFQSMAPPVLKGRAPLPPSPSSRGLCRLPHSTARVHELGVLRGAHLAGPYRFWPRPPHVEGQSLELPRGSLSCQLSIRPRFSRAVEFPLVRRGLENEHFALGDLGQLSPLLVASRASFTPLFPCFSFFPQRRLQAAATTAAAAYSSTRAQKRGPRGNAAFSPTFFSTACTATMPALVSALAARLTRAVLLC